MVYICMRLARGASAGGGAGRGACVRLRDARDRVREAIDPHNAHNADAMALAIACPPACPLDREACMPIIRIIRITPVRTRITPV